MIQVLGNVENIVHYGNTIYLYLSIADDADYLNLFPFLNMPLFLHVCSTSLLKTLTEKEKLLVTSNFSFSSQSFLPFQKAFHHFH